jgi:hypothetical protein
MIATDPSRRPVMRICSAAASPRAAFQRLRRVAHEIEQHAKQLVGIGVEATARARSR